MLGSYREGRVTEIQSEGFISPHDADPIAVSDSRDRDITN